MNHTSRAGEKILDYGSGPKAIHTQNLKQWGMDVTPHEFGANVVEGIHDTKALSRKYNTVMASNVLNTQSSEQMLRSTLAEIKSAVAPGGRAVFNYPVSPRYIDLTTDAVEKIVREYFPKLDRVGGTKWGPLWEGRVE